jgi:hypothetical protein
LGAASHDETLSEIVKGDEAGDTVTDISLQEESSFYQTNLVRVIVSTEFKVTSYGDAMAPFTQG